MKLREMVEKYPQTNYWNDSCDVNELRSAIENGAVGATTNPVIVYQVLKSNILEWENEIKNSIQLYPQKTEDEIAWEIIGKLGIKASELLLSKFEETNGQKGRISFQVNAKYDRDAHKIIEHAQQLNSLIPNAQIKAPTSKAGIAAFEELTYQGVSINATVSYTVSQAIAVAEAVERGLKRREAEGKDTTMMSPVCTIMAGRLDDYLKKVVNEQGIMLDPDVLEWAGVAVSKKVYQIFKERGYRTKMLIAAYRNHLHWSQLIGGDLIHTIPYGWQVKYNNSSIEVKDTIAVPVETRIMEQLLSLEEFHKAYDEKGLKEDEFHHYGAYLTTINQFLEGYDSLVALIRKYRINF